jgi:hypothetical protein
MECYRTVGGGCLSENEKILVAANSFAPAIGVIPAALN